MCESLPERRLCEVDRCSSWEENHDFKVKACDAYEDQTKDHDENMLLVKMREVTSKKRGVGPNPNVDA